MIPAACRAAFAEPLPALTQKSSAQLEELRHLRRRILGELLRQMPTSGHSVEIEFNAAAAELIVSGVVSTFHAKQTVYRLCQRLATRLDVVDEVVVDHVPPPCWSKVATARR
ncbi:MAG TPA: hypothetical protein VGN12_11315 [Pirellulales bacterium]|jgi:hypothetical protein